MSRRRDKKPKPDEDCEDAVSFAESLEFRPGKPSKSDVEACDKLLALLIRHHGSL